MAQIDIKDTSIHVLDGTATPNEIEISVGEGNLTWTERRELEYKLDRGILDEVREGDQQPMEVNLSYKWDYLQGSLLSGGDPSVREALGGTGKASSWTSTDSDACRPYAVDVQLRNVPTPAGCGDKETITLPDFRWEEQGPDLREGTVDVRGRCNVTGPTILRAVNT